MNKFYLLLFVTFLYCNTGRSQGNYSGQITYGQRIIGPGIDTSQVSNDQTKNVIAYQMKSAKQALSDSQELYKFNFNDHESLFEPIDILNNDANPVLSHIISKTKYYQNTKQLLNYERIEIFGKTYILQKKFSGFNWKIKNQTKRIAGYNCRLAVTSITIRNKTLKIKAWYTSDIPLSLGPKGFNGLPGIILGLEERGNYYFAMNVNLSKNKTIDLFDDGETISEAAYKKMVKKTIKSMRGE